MMKLPILPCAEKLEIVLSTAFSLQPSWHQLLPHSCSSSLFFLMVCGRLTIKPFSVLSLCGQPTHQIWSAYLHPLRKYEMHCKV